MKLTNLFSRKDRSETPFILLELNFIFPIAIFIQEFKYLNSCIVPLFYFLGNIIHIHVKTAGKCLGYWWLRELTASKSVDENIKKARRTFFHYGTLVLSKEILIHYLQDRIFRHVLCSGADEVSVTEFKRECDKERMIERCIKKAPLFVEVYKRGGHWPALWDAALQCGSRHTIGLQSPVFHQNPRSSWTWL